MTITTLDLALAGMQPPVWFEKGITPTLVAGRPHSTWFLGGNPGAGAVAANTANGVVQTAPVNGQIPFTNPGSGNSYLSMLRGFSATQAGTVLLIDRLLCCAGNSGGSQLSVTSTGAQTVNTTTLPARDRNGSTNGDGVLAALEVASVMGAGTPTISYSYTDESGNAGSTGQNTFAVVATSAAGTFYPLGLAAGDKGVRSIQTMTLSATMTSGQFQLVLYRILAAIDVGPSFTPGAAFNLASGGFPQIYNDSVLSLVFFPNTTTAANIRGMVGVTQG